MDQPTIENVRWNVPPPVDRPRYIPILSPKVGVPASALIVTSHLVGVETHFLSNRTKPCIGADNGCEGCKAQLSTRWKGYLGAWHPGFSRYVIVEVTAQAACDNHALLMDEERNLRGMTVVLHRRGKNRNAPVSAEFHPKRQPDDKVPAAFDVRKALLRIWERVAADAKDGLPVEVDQVDEP